MKLLLGDMKILWDGRVTSCKNLEDKYTCKLFTNISFKSINVKVTTMYPASSAHTRSESDCYFKNQINKPTTKQD